MSEPARITTAPIRRQALRDRVSDAIIAAAAEVLASSAGQASMNDVATAAGIARGTLYRYFPSRQALVAQLQEVAVEDASARLEASRIDQVAPADGLERAIRAFVDVGDPFLVAGREGGKTAGSDWDGAVVAPVRALLERGQAERVFRDDVPASWLAESLLAMVLAGVSREQLGKEDLIASVKLLFLDGARAR